MVIDCRVRRRRRERETETETEEARKRICWSEIYEAEGDEELKCFLVERIKKGLHV